MLDDITPFQQEGDDYKTYCFPRKPEPGRPGCISKKFIDLMNFFGNKDGFEAILDGINSDLNDRYAPSLQSITYLCLMIAMPL